MPKVSENTAEQEATKKESWLPRMWDAGVDDWRNEFIFGFPDYGPCRCYMWRRETESSKARCFRLWMMDQRAAAARQRYQFCPRAVV